MELVNTWVFGNHGLSTVYIQLKTQLLSQMYCRPCCYQLRNVIIYIADHYRFFSVCVTHYSSNADECTPSRSSSCTGLASTFNYYVIIRPPDIIIIQNMEARSGSVLCKTTLGGAPERKFYQCSHDHSDDIII